MGSEEARAILAVASAPPQKNGGVAAALWFFLAGFGGPWWYLGRPVIAIAAMCMYWLCGVLIFVGVGLFLLPGLWLIDAISVYQSVRGHNQKRLKMLKEAVATS